MTAMEVRHPPRSLLRIPTRVTSLPNTFMPLADAVANSPVKYSRLWDGVGHDTRVPTPSPSSTDGARLPPVLPLHSLSTWRKEVTLPWSASTRRPVTAGAAADGAVYDTDNTVAGVPTLATKVRASLTKPWPQPRGLSWMAGRAASRAAARRDPLGPGCYGAGGVVDRPDRPRSVCGVRPSTTQRLDPRDEPTALDVTYADTMPPFKMTQAWRSTPSLRSTVPRFQPLPGMEQDEATKSVLARLPLPDDRGSLAQTMHAAPLAYKHVFGSKGGRGSNDAAAREMATRARARDAVLLGADRMGTIGARLEDARVGVASVPLRSRVSSRQSGRLTGAEVGPGAYLDGMVRGDLATRPRSGGATVLPTSTTPRFREHIQAYKTLGTMGSIPDDSVLGHRDTTTRNSKRVNLDSGDGHANFHRAVTASHGPDVVYRTDVAGSPAASLATELLHGTRRGIMLGPPPTSTRRGSSDPHLPPARPTSPTRPTYLTQLESTLLREGVGGARGTPPPLPTITNAGLPATIHVTAPDKPSHFMATEVDGGRGLTVQQEQVRLTSRMSQRAAATTVAARERRSSVGGGRQRSKGGRA